MKYSSIYNTDYKSGNKPTVQAKLIETYFCCRFPVKSFDQNWI